MAISTEYPLEEVQSAIKTAAPRFRKKVNRNGPLMPGMVSRCWEWQGSGLQDGYGQFRIVVRGRGLLKMPHNCAWVLAGGQLPPPGFILHHLCENPGCVCPHHLAVVTQAAHRRQHSVLFLATCPQGHPFDETDPLIDSKGYRRCRECAGAARQRYNDKKRGRHAA